MSGVARFESYAAPNGARCVTTRIEGGGGPGAPGIATAFREVDQAADRLTAVQRDNQRLRRSAANALAAAEAERVESARLRAQNLDLANQLAKARAPKSSSEHELRAHSSEERPAPHPTPLDGAALGTLSRDELMDAARACEYRAEAFTTAGTWSEYWMHLARRFEEAAIAASQ